MAQRAELYIQVPPQGSGEKRWIEQITDGVNNLDIDHVSLGVDLVLVDNASISGAPAAIIVYVGANREVTALVNVKTTPTGTTPTLTVALQDVDPGDLTTVWGTAATTGSLNATGIFKATLQSRSGYVKLTQILTGTTPVFPANYISISTKDVGSALGDTGTPANVSIAASSFTVLAANGNHKGRWIYNDAGARVLILFGAGTASSSNFSMPLFATQAIYLGPGEYAGQITGIGDAATGILRVTEVT